MSYNFWIVTVPEADWTPPTELPNGIIYIKGQLEEGQGGFRHWQLVFRTARKIRLSAAKRLLFPGVESAHLEATRSGAANDYVWKDETCVDSATRFELGSLPMRRDSSKDWDHIWNAAKAGDLESIPPDVRVRSYNAIKRIEKDHLKPIPREVEVYVYWGETNAGKSRRAWTEATFDAYPKDPNTKYWDGYQGEEDVVIDEFVGVNQISITNMLRWLDRYPVAIETKHSGAVLRATRFWITSNVDPKEWYPEAPEEQRKALRRRFTRVIHFVNMSESG